MNEDFAVLKRMLESEKYKRSLIDRIKTGKAGPSLVNMLKDYARGTDAEARDHAQAILKEAGVEWT
jgi:hypothetical protein